MIKNSFLAEVTFNIGILKSSDKQLYYTSTRQESNNKNEDEKKAISKFRTFYKDLLDTEFEYVLTFENGDVVNIIPGTIE